MALSLTTAPTRLTLTGDWHSQAGFGEHVIHRARDVGADGLVQLGDFGIWPGRHGELFLDRVDKALERNGLDLWFVDGNHDDHEQLLELPVQADGRRQVRSRIFHLPRGFRWEWGGVRYLALGGATSLDRPSRTPYVNWWPQEEITSADVIRAGTDPVDVMVTHDCPLGITVPNIPPASSWPPAELQRAYLNRMALTEVVEAVRPTHLFHGHFHSRYAAELALGTRSCLVTGLDDHRSMSRNYMHLETEAFKREVELRR